MKRLQIMIEEDLDAALERQAAQEGASKAALIRRYVRERLRPLPPLDQDPLWDLVGMCEGAPDDSARIDEVVYGLGREDGPPRGGLALGGGVGGVALLERSRPR